MHCFSAQGGGGFQRYATGRGIARSPSLLDSDVGRRLCAPGSSPRTVMPDEKLRVGIAGAGHFGRYHALKVAASSRARLAGIHDPDLERAKAVGWETGTQEMYFDALLDACDALIVAAPADVHYDLAAQALRAGKHVLVEKPIAATLAQADDLGALAKERGLVLQ